VTEAMPDSETRAAFLAVQNQKFETSGDAQTVVSRPTSTLAPTTSSTVVPAKLERAEILETLNEQNDDDTRSQTSYATSVREDDSDNRLSVRLLEEVLEEVARTRQSFECPYC
jgi:hypothetical protein